MFIPPHDGSTVVIGPSVSPWRTLFVREEGPTVSAEQSKRELVWFPGSSRAVTTARSGSGEPFSHSSTIEVASGSRSAPVGPWEGPAVGPSGGRSAPVGPWEGPAVGPSGGRSAPVGPWEGPAVGPDRKSVV